MTLPDYLFSQLQTQAAALGQPVGELAAQLLSRALPPVEDDLPPAIQAELHAMASLSTDALWQIARSAMNADKIALYDVLLERHGDATLTWQGQELLTDLRTEADALMLRKAHAYALLQSRGVRLPSLEDLHEQAA